MNRGPWIGAGAVAAFLIVLAARFPARWAAGLLPRGTACTQLSGTLWSGACGGLTSAGVPLGDLSWSAHPLRLITGKLSVSVSLIMPSGSARALLLLSPTGAIGAEDMRATVPLSHALLTEVPPDVQGVVAVNLAALHWNGRRVTALRGEFDVQGLAVQGESLGDYRLSFPGGSSDEPVGQLEDVGGPLSVHGTLRLTRQPGFVLDALVASRANAPRDLVQDLRFLGSPDAQGRRPFSLAGTF
jgi:general secretion pathway protein N